MLFAMSIYVTYVGYLCYLRCLSMSLTSGNVATGQAVSIITITLF